MTTIAPAGPGRTAASGRYPYRWIAAVAMMIAVLMDMIDVTIVNVALATIGRELPGAVLGTLEGLTYVTSGYFATLAALLVLSGALADYYGRRRVFIIGLAGFGATSALCGLAPSLELLVLARIFQGAAGALLVPGAIAIQACGRMAARAWSAAQSRKKRRCGLPMPTSKIPNSLVCRPSLMTSSMASPMKE